MSPIASPEMSTRLSLGLSPLQTPQVPTPPVRSPFVSTVPPQLTFFPQASQTGSPGEDEENGTLVSVSTTFFPGAALDPPAVLALIVEQRAASAAHVIFEPYLRILLHIHLDCVPSAVVP